MFHIPSLREAMFGDPYLSPCPWDHFAASCRISLKTRTSGYTLNLTCFSLRLQNSYWQQGGCSLVPGWLVEVLPSLHKEVIHNHHKKRDQLLDCCVCRRAYKRLGIPMQWMHTAHPGICTQVCPLPKNVMSNSGIFPKSTGIPRTHDWQ